MALLQPLLGLALFLGIALVLSSDRRSIRPAFVGLSLAAQTLLAVILLKLPFVADALLVLNKGVQVLQEATDFAAVFMFGYLAGGDQPFEEVGNSFIIAFRVLPLILVVSALSAVLFHWKVLPTIIRGLAMVLQRGLKLSGPLAFAAASSVFFGIIESPLLIRPYLQRMSRGEILALMSCGMATVAGTVMVLYASVVEPVMPGALGHILVASVISVPAALMYSHVLIPTPPSEDEASVEAPSQDHNTMDALMRGTKEGTSMVIDIAATIVVLFALVHMANRGLGLFPGEPTLQGLVGWGFRPLVWGMGIPAEDVAWCAELMGTKTVLNEFVAYLTLANAGGGPIAAESRTILIYAMCGFANFGSLGILVGGLGSLLPDRRAELFGLGVRAMVAGTLATCTTGALAALLI
jgi:concentrative nucleoside transporter, CNT family